MIKNKIIWFFVLSLFLHFVFLVMFSPKKYNPSYQRIFSYGQKLDQVDLKNFYFKRSVDAYLKEITADFEHKSDQKIKTKPDLSMSYPQNKVLVYNSQNENVRVKISGSDLVLGSSLDFLNYMKNLNLKNHSINLKVLVSPQGNIVFFKGIRGIDSIYSFIALGNYLRNILIRPSGKYFWTEVEILL